jgi:glycerol-3-phosphate dehydrogenase
VRGRGALLVNAAGPWVDRVLSETVGQNDVHNVRLVQGSHIVVPKKFDDPRAYFFQNRDGRIIFAIPYEDDFTLIGTTDQDYVGDPAPGGDQRPGDRLSVRRGQRVFRRAGHAARTSSGPIRRAPALRRRRLEGAGSDARLCAEGRWRAGQAPLLNAFGGKITTYRRLAESMLEKIEDCSAARKAVDRRRAAARRRFRARISTRRSRAQDAPILFSTPATRAA